MSRKEGKNIKKILVGSLIAVFIMSLMAGLIPYDLGVQPVSAASTMKAPIHINNTAGGALSYYQVNLNITYDSDMNSDFSDIRVKNEAAGTFVPYWIEDKSDGVWCNLWFNATSISASAWCNDTYYLHYGDTGASSASNGTNTFEFFDDFDRGKSISELWLNDIIGRPGHKRFGNILNNECIIFVAAGIYQVYKLSDGEKILNETVGNTSWEVVTLDVADVNEDGKLEIAFTEYNKDITNGVVYVYLLSENGSVIWKRGPYADTGGYTHRGATYVKIGDLDTNKTGLEIAAVTINHLRVFDKDGNELWNHTIGEQGSEVANGPSIADVDGDGKNEILVFPNQGPLWCFKGDTGDVLWNHTLQSDGEDIYCKYDMDGDEKPDVIVGLNNEAGTPAVVALDGDNGNILWSHNTVDDVERAMQYLNNENETEIAISGRSGVPVKIYNKTGTLIWVNEHRKELASSGLDVADVNNDGKLEVIVCRGPYLCIFSQENGSLLYETYVADIGNVPYLKSWAHDGDIYTFIWEYNSALQRWTIAGEGESTKENYENVSENWTWNSDASYITCSGNSEHLLIAKSFNMTVDHIIMSKMKADGIDSNQRVPGVVFAYQNYSNFYYARTFWNTQKIGLGMGIQFLKRVDGNFTNLDNADYSPTEGQWSRLETYWNESEITIYVDGSKYINRTSDLESWTDGKIGLRDKQNAGGLTSFFDYLIVRKYASPEPTALLGSEQSTGNCTTPVISDLTNSTPGITNVTITWTTNQSADSRVKYSKNSDLSSHSWSSWDNNTYSISIDISSLDSGTPYYYQAWSYNGTNSSCYVTEPTGQPYKTFTTQSDTGGAYNITLLTGWNIIGWTDTTTRTASYVANDIGSNCTYVTERNKTSGNYETFDPNFPDYYNFDVERGWGYFTMVSGETLWERDA